MATAKFKVGDKLLINEGNAGLVHYPSGQFVVAETTVSNGETYYRKKDGYYMEEKDLTLVTAVVSEKLRKKRVKKITISDIDEIVGQDVVKRQLGVAIKRDIPALLVGDTGTGKTSVVRELAKENNKKFTRIPITGETTPEDLLGKYELVNGDTKWIVGILIQAMLRGDYLTIDEINMALPEVLALLYELFDDSKSVTVTQHDGEIVKPHKDFRAFATMNPVDEYAGTKELNKALKSRFGMTIEMRYVDAETEVQIVTQKCKIEEDVARKIVDFGQWARQAKEEDEIFYTCSTRDLLQWGHLANDLPMDEAFELAVLNKGNGDREKMSKFYKELVDNYKGLVNDGYKLSIDYFNKEKSKIDRAKVALAEERTLWEKDIKKTTEKIRKDVVKGLVESSKTLSKPVKA